MFKIIVVLCVVSCILAEPPVPSYGAPPAPAPAPKYPPPPPQYGPPKGEEAKPVEGKLEYEERGAKADISDFPTPSSGGSKSGGSYPGRRR